MRGTRIALAATLGLLAACDRSVPPDAAAFASSLRDRVGVEAVMTHLAALQDIADKHNNTRAAGTPGFDRSVDYVVKALKDKGFDVQTPEFDFTLFHAGRVELTHDSVPVDATVLTYSPAATDVRGRLVPARTGESPGCTAADYDGIDVAGAVVLVDRGSCPFADKEKAAAERGAVALVVADNVDEDKMGATLGAAASPKIPVVGIAKALGAKLRAQPGSVTLGVDAGTTKVRTRNVLAQTKTGSTGDVVMAGAHLDSVTEGPGINDNGSGSAALLETALQLGPSPDVRNAVRFAWWSAEEEGLFGSTDYVRSLTVEQLKDIALYLNYDMLASPNAGYLTYDGDQSSPESNAGRIPEGSAGIERTEVEYLAGAGKKAHDTAFNGRSDYDAFSRTGIPVGGIDSGAEATMSPEEAKDWGGQAGKPFDPNYHSPKDNLDNVNRDALRINSRAVAYTVGLYSQSIDGRNGVPQRGDRTRHEVPEK